MTKTFGCTGRFFLHAVVLTLDISASDEGADLRSTHHASEGDCKNYVPEICEPPTT